MGENVTGATEQVGEAAAVATLIEAARRRQQAAQEKSPQLPRFLLEIARTMAAHTSMPDQRMQDCLASMALWQLYMPSAMATHRWNFAAARDFVPDSYERIRAALAPLETRPQLVSTIYHMAGFPLLAMLVGSVWRDMHEGPLHLLISANNMSFIRLEPNRWIFDAAVVLHTGPGGLRPLMAGLKEGTIRRMLILADGPQAPGPAGTRALDGISPGLGIRTTLMAKIHALGIPLVPITHEWEDDRLVVTPRPMLDPATIGETETIDAMVAYLEDLLRRHPEQWLNWSAASIRT